MRRYFARLTASAPNTPTTGFETLQEALAWVGDAEAWIVREGPGYFRAIRVFRGECTGQCYAPDGTVWGVPSFGPGGFGGF